MQAVVDTLTKLDSETVEVKDRSIWYRESTETQRRIVSGDISPGMIKAVTSEPSGY